MKKSKKTYNAPAVTLILALLLASGPLPTGAEEHAITGRDALKAFQTLLPGQSRQEEAPDDQEETEGFYTVKDSETPHQPREDNPQSSLQEGASETGGQGALDMGPINDLMKVHQQARHATTHGKPVGSQPVAEKQNRSAQEPPPPPRDSELKLEPQAEDKDERTAATPDELIEKIHASGLTTQIVYEDSFTPVKISQKDISRIVCTGNITRVVYSKEKGMDVVTQGREAFVKNSAMEVTKSGGSTTLKYDKTPKELYVLCAGKTFSLLLVPDDIPSTTIYLKTLMGDNDSAASYERATDYQNTILRLIRDVYKENVPDGFRVKNINALRQSFLEADVIHKRTYIGYTLAVEEYILRAKKPIHIDEIALLESLDVKKPLAISIVDGRLQRTQETRVIVVREADNE
jgi:conjugal transfer pilus assembly protein TraK